MLYLFLNLLRTSLLLTPAVLLLVFLMPRLGRRYTPGLRCLVWLLATLRLLIPFTLSLGGMYAGSGPAANLLDQVDQGAVAEALAGLLSAEPGAAAAGPAITPTLLMAVWITGLLLFLAFHGGAYLLLCRRLRRWRIPADDPFAAKTLDDVGQRLSIEGHVPLYRTRQVQTPMLTGYFRPCIYLPDKPFSAAELWDILSHELCHYKRRDLWFKLGLFLANAVHWFNPAVYLMFRQAELDMEMACDSQVLQGASPGARRQYGLTILSYIRREQAVPVPFTTYFYGGKKQMKLRFAGMIDKNKKKPGILFLALCVLLMALCGAWTRSPLRTDDADAWRSETGSTPTNATAGLAWPVPGYYDISSPYGWRFDNQDFHTGMDIVGSHIFGAPVIAAEGGTVSVANTEALPGVGYGIYAVIEHEGGASTLYGQMSSLQVQAGDKVEKGQVIGAVGSTGWSSGPHLHFEYRENGLHTDPAPHLEPQP